jgi:Flp pilus assembly pilin Flp
MSISNYVQLIKSVREREEGQTMAEYAVVLGVITVACLAVFGALSGAIQSAVNTVVGAI